MAALQAKDVETRVFELNHAMVVIGYLQYVLDFERGGEPAKHFSQFYNSARALVLQANFKAAPGPIEELIAMFSEVRQAWYQAEQLALPVRNEAPAADRAGANAAAETSPSDDGANKSQLQWSA
jgi:flagellin-specific chaperone FliS